MTKLSPNTIGIIAMLFSSMGFIFNDALIKLAAEQLPQGEAIFLRGAFGITFMTLAAWYTGALANMRQVIRPSVGLRVLGETVATVFYLAALFRSPIAVNTAILQVLPLLVTAGSAIFLHEVVGWRRWTAIAVGFCGVLLIVRPGLEGFTIWSLSALLGVFFMALRDLSTRRIPAHVPTFSVALASITGTTLAIGALMKPFEVWIMPDLVTLAYLAGAALFILVGFVSVIIAMRTGEISVVAPFRYSIVLWAILLGIVIWGEYPDPATLAGITIIIGTGIYTFVRERKARAQAARG
ncbi:DMT family transporter [Breoghania sp. L-A4]|uniref:DMT family transporter n=1 Tax=Breoghania sp. L-A4 TaxID=2304600 RepID=UPI000E35ED30|nr:DMT family transporter [Breoghania sp. L-A4]AXS40147.1 DMT family transporter [Breoghania sp. L-A4]